MKLKKDLILTLLAIVCLTVLSTTKLVAQETKDEDFKPSGNLWGYVFGDYAFKMHNDTMGRGAGNVQYKGAGALSSGNTNYNAQTSAFQVRRVYLGYDYQFAKKFSASLVLADEQTVLGNNQNTFYLKYANLKWSNIFKNTDLIVGQFQTCSFANPFNSEPLWSYRASERTLVDMHNIDGSTDLGVSLQGRLWTQKTAKDSLKPTIIGYAIQVGNGSSATPETDIFKKVRGNVYVSLLSQSLTIGVYGDFMRQQLSPYHTENVTFKAYASYKNDWFRLGAEVFQQTNLHSDIYKVSANGVVPGTATNDTTTGVQMGWSVFASGRILKNKLNIFARFDMFNPDTKWNKNNVYSGAYSGIKGSNLTTATFYTQTFLNAGLDWTPNSRVHIMPNIWYNSYKSMITTAAPGGTGADLSSRVKMDNDLVYRLTFYFVFNGSKKISNNGMNY